MLLALARGTFASTTFGTSLKGARLRCGEETPVFSRACAADESPCAMHHWWSGGSFAGYSATRVRYHVDNASTVELPLGPAHGLPPDDASIGFDFDNGPWTAGALFGKSGVGTRGAGARPSSSRGSGLFNTFTVPFGASVRVTVSLGCPAGSQYFWLIVRGPLAITRARAPHTR